MVVLPSWLTKDSVICWSCKWFVATDAAVGVDGLCYVIRPASGSADRAAASIADGQVYTCEAWAHTQRDVPEFP